MSMKSGLISSSVKYVRIPAVMKKGRDFTFLVRNPFVGPVLTEAPLFFYFTVNCLKV